MKAKAIALNNFTVALLRDDSVVLLTCGVEFPESITPPSQTVITYEELDQLVESAKQRKRPND